MGEGKKPLVATASQSPVVNPSLEYRQRFDVDLEALKAEFPDEWAECEGGDEADFIMEAFMALGSQAGRFFAVMDDEMEVDFL